jgi:cellobiose phosphorylase
MYRLVLESLLGLRLEVDKLHFFPCLPADWEGFTVHYRYRETTYHISVTQTDGADGVAAVTLDGVARDEETIPLVDDHQDHSVELRVRRADSSTPIELDSDGAGHAEQLQTD